MSSGWGRSLIRLKPVAGVLRVPGSLAFVLEAAGAISLERAGAILEERVRAAALEAGP